jgi:hypothetical protein
MKMHIASVPTLLRASAALVLSWVVLTPLPGRAQLTPAQISTIRSVQGNRVEALTILGGDFGLSGATFVPKGNTDRDVTLNVSKFGGAGDIGDPRPLGNTGIGWQPRLQGSMGYLTSHTDYSRGLQEGDESKFKTYAIQFGGGARFWFNDHLSLAPTFMGMYGHTKNDYTPRSAFGQANYAEATQLGLINWWADTWTVRPSGQLAWVQPFHRTLFTLASDGTYFYTESFRASSTHANLSGNSETWRNLIDVDIPLGKQLFGHELRTGGYFSRTELYNGVQDGLNTDHIYEAHGRVVLDFLGHLWKVQWIGIGGSYLWGSNFKGYSVGADVAFRF